MLVCSGLTECSVAFAASVHLAAAWGIVHPCALNGPQFLTDDVAAKTLPREGDAVLVTDDPGLGIEVDEDKVRHFAAQGGLTDYDWARPYSYYSRWCRPPRPLAAGSA